MIHKIYCVILASVLLPNSPLVLVLSMSAHPVNTATTVSNRIFVSGLRTLCCEEDLKCEFAKYGPVQSIEIISYEDRQKKTSKRKRREPFAFVTFESEDIATKVVSKYANKMCIGPSSTCSNSDTNDTSQEMPLFSIVKPANPRVVRQAKRIRKGLTEQEQILQICQQEQKPTLLLQVQSSHLDRVTQYITDLAKETGDHPFVIPTAIGSSSSKAKNISFVFLHVTENDHTSARTYWYDHFVSNPVLTRFGVRKIYAVDQIVQVPSSKQDDVERSNFLVDHALDTIENKLNVAGDITLKVQTFPPKQNDLQHQVIASLDRQVGAIEKNQDPAFQYPNLRQRNLSMSSTDYTHTFSCVQVFNPRNQAFMKSSDNCTIDEIFMIGIAPQTPNEKANAGHERGDEEDDKEICRAYFKLKEVMDNYRRDEKGIKMDFKDMDAFDCGSSPGGWTKYLLETEKCNTCFSCDPGALDDSVKAMKGARHLQMRGNVAIDLLQKEGETVNLWVSDMCLADPKDQVDHLVLAKEKGVLNNDSFFVLTLKFNTGHSKDTFDLFAGEELKRLKEKIKVENVQTYHLFSNRKGERTLIGRTIA